MYCSSCGMRCSCQIDVALPACKPPETNSHTGVGHHRAQSFRRYPRNDRDLAECDQACHVEADSEIQSPLDGRDWRHDGRPRIGLLVTDHHLSRRSEDQLVDREVVMSWVDFVKAGPHHHCHPIDLVWSEQTGRDTQSPVKYHGVEGEEIAGVMLVPEDVSTRLELIPKCLPPVSVLCLTRNHRDVSTSRTVRCPPPCLKHRLVPDQPPSP